MEAENIHHRLLSSIVLNLVLVFIYLSRYPYSFVTNKYLLNLIPSKNMDIQSFMDFINSKLLGN